MGNFQCGCCESRDKEGAKAGSDKSEKPIIIRKERRFVKESVDDNLYHSELAIANAQLQDMDLYNHDVHHKNSVESLKLKMEHNDDHSSYIEEDRSRIMGTPELEELKRTGHIRL